MLGRVDAAGAEGHREQGEQRRHRQREQGRGRAGRQAVMRERVEHRENGLRDRLELQRDIGGRGHQRDGGRERGDALRLAVARRDEVGDRGEILVARKRHDALDQPEAETDHQDRPDIDRQEIEPALRGESDGAVIGPGRAVDAEAEGVDERAPAPAQEARGREIAAPGDEEQQPAVAQRGRENGGRGQHGGAVGAVNIGSV